MFFGKTVTLFMANWHLFGLLVKKLTTNNVIIS